jgi:hypothetical protein
MWDDEEVTLRKLVGRKLHLAFHIQSARNVPRLTCGGVFVSFKFYMSPQPLTTFRCPQATCNPVFDQVIPQE